MLTIGFTISLLQALTQIQEVTLAFLPKVAAVGLALLALRPRMGREMQAWATRLFGPVVLLRHAVTAGAALLAPLPGLGEADIPATQHLALGLDVTMALLPAIAPALPPLPESSALLAALVAGNAWWGCGSAC